jgi:hypothetical protein
VARPREAVGCRTLICRKADSGQLNDLATTRQVELRDRQFVQPASCRVNTTAYLSPSGRPERRFDGDASTLSIRLDSRRRHAGKLFAQALEIFRAISRPEELNLASP